MSNSENNSYASSQQTNGYPAFIFLVLICSLGFLLFFPNTLPLHDYPSHIARLFILHLDGSDPVIANHIQVNWIYVANLALEIFTYPLHYITDADTSGRIFILLGFLLTASGTIFLHRTLGGRGPWPYVIFLFLINDIFLYGFLSFLLSMGLVLWVYAFWLRAQSKSMLFKLAVFSPVAFFLLTCHLFAFCVYALLVGSYEIAALIKRLRQKQGFFTENLIAGALHFVPAFILFILASDTSEDGVALIYIFPDLMRKLSGLAGTSSWYEIRLQLVLIGLGIAALLLMWKKGNLKLAPNMWVYLVLGIVFTVIVPESIFGTAYLDYRMPVAILPALIAAIQIKEGSINDRLFLTAVAALCLLQYAYVGYNWKKYDRLYDDLFVVTEQLEPGDTLLHLNVAPKRFTKNLAPPLTFTVNNLVDRKRIITPFLFADPRQQPIRYLEDPQLPEIIRARIVHFGDKEFAELQKALVDPNALEFDYLLTTGLKDKWAPDPEKWTPVARKSIYRLYKSAPAQITDHAK